MDQQRGAPPPGAVPWRQAWQEALYGPHGFYRAPPGPSAHFTTATHGPSGRLLAKALWGWADLLGLEGLVDVGAGRGELVGQLRLLAPDRPVTAVDVVPRPPGMPPDIGWLQAPGGAQLPDELAPANALVVAHEWLDVVPCTVAEHIGDGSLREVLVDPRTGAETLGGELDDVDLQWCHRYWPPSGHAAADDDAGADDAELESQPAGRVEVGRQRDAAWQSLLDRMSGGVAIAVDYGHTAGARPPHGTLTAYRAGLQVAPVPDGSCDLTAHVAVDSLRHDELLSQRAALRRVGVDAGVPDHRLATTDPAGYLSALASTSAAASLVDPGGFGGFWWVVARP